MHIPVLYQEVLEWLQPRAGGLYVDGTLGGAGHAQGILERSAPDGRLLGLDADAKAVKRAKKRLAPFGNRTILVHSNFALLQQMVEKHDFGPVDGILLDLGLSSFQLDNADRGFTFQQDGPLDMRFNGEQRLTAADLVNNLEENELADLIYEYGEERYSRRIARILVANRPITSTDQLAHLVASAVRGYQRIHPATRVFQALRIGVNRELDVLEAVLPQARDLLAPGGRIVVISFHSGEDRIVKHYFRRESQDCICPPEAFICVCDHQASLQVLTKKPIRPTQEEIDRNPRSRSAKMRVAEKLGSET